MSQIFYEVLMEKRANALKWAVDRLERNPYVIPGVIGGGLAGAAVADEGERTKGALGGALVGGLVGKGLQSGLSHLARKRGANMGDLEHTALASDYLRDAAKANLDLEKLPVWQLPEHLRTQLEVLRSAEAVGDYSLHKGVGTGLAAGTAAGGLTAYGLLRKRPEDQQQGT
jgi:hypothetical protein